MDSPLFPAITGSRILEHRNRRIVNENVYL
jgi:hypothetical protein